MIQTRGVRVVALRKDLHVTISVQTGVRGRIECVLVVFRNRADAARRDRVARKWLPRLGIDDRAGEHTRPVVGAGDSQIHGLRRLAAAKPLPGEEEKHTVPSVVDLRQDNRTSDLKIGAPSWWAARADGVKEITGPEADGVVMQPCFEVQSVGAALGYHSYF